jgi:uncharacterized protein (DUF3084 family)
MDTSLLATVIIPTVLTSIGGIWAAVQHFQKRKDNKEEKELTFDQAREKEIIDLRKQLAQEVFQSIQNKNADIIACRAELDERDKRLRDKDQEITKFSNLARFWHSKSWDMRSEAAYARQIVESAARISGGTMPVWYGSLELPPFDDPNRRQSDGGHSD